MPYRRPQVEAEGGPTQTARTLQTTPSESRLRSPRPAPRDTRALFRSLRSGILVTDTAAVAVSVAVAQLVRFGGDSPGVVGQSVIGYTAVSIALATVWILALRVTQSTDRRFIGEGATEYARVVRGTFGTFGFVAIVGTVLKLQFARGYVAVAFPLGLVLLIASRWLWRKALAFKRKRGQLQRRVIVVGGATLPELLPLVRSGNSHAWHVVGVCRTNGEQGTGGLGFDDIDLPLATSWRDVRNLVEQYDADTVAVSGVESIGMQGMRELSWDLEGLDVDLLVAPGVMDVAGPRMHLRPVAGLPLLHVDKPRYEGANRLTKVLFDKLGASLLVLLASPVLIVCALAVRLSGPGPIFYVSERIGLHNTPFGMIKFRSMVQGAEAMKVSLIDQNESEGGVLFKIRDDPRVTPVGEVLRRFSLDELPQLFNVIKGDMSLVGPRPPLREEVNQYSELTSRRMLVRPGMTGLWQVSGRSNLSWDESVRLDLTYVENWSLMQDLLILWKTARAVLGSDGAY